MRQRKGASEVDIASSSIYNPDHGEGGPEKDIGSQNGGRVTLSDFQKVLESTYQNKLQENKNRAPRRVRRGEKRQYLLSLRGKKVLKD